MPKNPLLTAQRAVLQDDESRVKNLRIDEFEASPRIAGIDWLPANNAEDHRKDYEPESIDESELHHALNEADTPNGSKRIPWLLFECSKFVCNGVLH